jgi:hypothetical protein
MHREQARPDAGSFFIENDYHFIYIGAHHKDQTLLRPLA